MAETNTPAFDAAAFTAQGTPRDRVALPAETFDGTVNLPVMHQAVKAFLANQRQGNASTKTRGEVVGGNQKPWKQKGTGRARQGSIRSPNWVGGGTVFGPRPRKYTEIVPKQVRALARKSAFNARAREGSLIVIDAFNYEAPKTSRLQQLLARLELAHRKVLILTDGVKPNVSFGAQPAARARHAVQRRLHLPHPLVGCGAGRVGRARRGDGAGEGEGAREREGGAVRRARTEDRGPKTEDDGRRAEAGSQEEDCGEGEGCGEEEGAGEEDRREEAGGEGRGEEGAGEEVGSQEEGEVIDADSS